MEVSVYVAPWCGICREFVPVVEHALRDFALTEGVRVVSLGTDNGKREFADAQVEAVPTVVFRGRPRGMDPYRRYEVPSTRLVGACQPRVVVGNASSAQEWIARATDGMPRLGSTVSSRVGGATLAFPPCNGALLHTKCASPNTISRLGCENQPLLPAVTQDTPPPAAGE
jgi:hypothetical protein